MLQMRAREGVDRSGDLPPRIGLSAAGGSAEHRILEAALRSLGRSGLQGLNMRDVSVQAGIGRATLYRYFASKDALLSALASYERERFQDGLRRAMDGSGDRSKADTLVRYLFEYLQTHPALKHLVTAEPAFVLGYLHGHQAAFREMCQAALGSALADAPVVRARVMSASELMDVILRMLMSTFLLPPTDPKKAEKAIRAATAHLLRGGLDAPEGSPSPGP